MSNKYLNQLCNGKLMITCYCVMLDLRRGKNMGSILILLAAVHSIASFLSAKFVQTIFLRGQ